MGGKKWCQYCHINIPYNKKDIQEHEETRMHLHNKSKTIKYERIKIQKQEKQKRQVSKQNALLGTANIPKAKKGSELQKQVQDYRQGIIASGKAAIHQLIAQKTKGMYGAPIQFPNKEDLVLAENYQEEKSEVGSDSQSEELDMWRIDICQETGDPCFINNVTKAKFYDIPKGYILSESQKEQWEYMQKICQDKVQLAGDNTVNISDWQQVEQEDDFFKINEIKQEDEVKQKIEQKQKAFKRPFDSLGYKQEELQNQLKEQEIKKSWMQELEQKINNNEVNANDVIQTVVYNKLKQCKNIKEKNETLKQLIKNGIQIRQTIEDLNRNQVKLEENTKSVGFKPKKKLKTQNLIDKDIF